MSVWIIDPHDPLIFRDGRPFEATPGARAQSLPFPFPSTIAGGIRMLAGLDEQGRFIVQRNELAQLKKLALKGPILVELTRDGRDIDPDRWLVPAPGDAWVPQQAIEGSASQYRLSRLAPLPWDPEVKTDLPARAGQPELLLVGRKDFLKEKPHTKAPRYWYWKQFETWLTHPKTFEKEAVTLSELGHNGPSEQVRVHVAIDPLKRVGRDQFLFDTVGMEFAALVNPSNPAQDAQEEIEPRLHLHHVRRLALAVLIDDVAAAGAPYRLNAERHQRISSLGGERRLASWRQSQVEAPTCPETLKEAIGQDEQCRLILLTPASFEQGYYPTHCLHIPEAAGVQVTLQAIKIDRSQVISGFDMERGRPKGTRRLAPAGTVLFLKLNGKKDEIARWVEAAWLRCFSEGMGQHGDEAPQERYDGFGLAVPGRWPKEDREGEAWGEGGSGR